MTNSELLQKLDETIKRHSLLTHPFYLLWNEGRLTQESLVEYAKQYYAHVKAFPTYLSGVHSHCEDFSVRQLLLENLMDEERGEENHPELWKRFAEGLGVEREDVESAELLPETRESVDTLKQLTQSEDFRNGVAALYAYESQVPEIAKTKREGLTKFYGIDDSRTVSYFKVHETADVEHSDTERSILTKYCTTEETQKQALDSTEKSAKAMWTFLDGVYENYVN